MKKLILVIIVGYCLGEQICFAQTNTFPSSGNAGIGTSSPSSNLEIVSSSLPELRIRQSSESSSWGLYLNQASDLSSHIVAAGRDLEIVAGWDKKLILGNVNYNTNGGTVIFPGGKVGIGTYSPSSKLSVYEAGSPTILTVGNPSTTSGGFTSVQLGTSADTNGYTFLSSVKSSGSAYGNMIINGDGGYVGIGCYNPDAKLTVNGQIHATEVKVTTTVPIPDYVFEKSYELASLESVKSYIDQNKHLPEVPSASEIEKNGIRLGEMNMLLLKKIEELTLHLIEIKQENDLQKKAINELEQDVKILKSR